MKARDLNEIQQKLFFEVFYDLAPDDLDDLESPNPWGCPWIWKPNYDLRGHSIEEMAKNFWYENANEIFELLDKDLFEENDDDLS
jgi:hypothetical protein